MKVSTESYNKGFSKELYNEIVATKTHLATTYYIKSGMLEDHRRSLRFGYPSVSVLLRDKGGLVAIAYAFEKFWKNGVEFVSVGVFVKKEYRGKGLAGKLLKKLLLKLTPYQKLSAENDCYKILRRMAIGDQKLNGKNYLKFWDYGAHGKKYIKLGKFELYNDLVNV